MAVEAIPNVLGKRWTWTLSWTADGDNIIELPGVSIVGISFTSDGNDGGGTLTWLVSNDNATFSALGVQTSADPRNATAVTSATAAGNWQVDIAGLSYRYLKFTLASSTNPTIKVYVSVLGGR